MLLGISSNLTKTNLFDLFDLFDLSIEIYKSNLKKKSIKIKFLEIKIVTILSFFFHNDYDNS